jgi:hypothetical protein
VTGLGPERDVEDVLAAGLCNCRIKLVNYDDFLCVISGVKAG